MKFTNIRVMNFENAIRGMRNPKNSWHLSDSYFGMEFNDCGENILLHTHGNPYEITYKFGDCCEFVSIGPKDMALAQRLIKAGSEHRKFLRQIFVSVDITAPLYWWKEFDTYKVGTVANSTSTMHKLDSKPITIDCFEIDDYHPINFEHFEEVEMFIDYLEKLRQSYVETKDKKYWKELVRWLPSGWLQTRTVTMSYENLLAICSPGQRRNHKLTEWSQSFMRFARSLPYAQQFIFIDEEPVEE